MLNFVGRTFVEWGLCALMPFGLGGSAVTDEEAKREFLQNYPAALQRLEAFYSQIDVQATESYKSRQFDELYDVRVAVNLTSFRIDRTLRTVRRGHIEDEGRTLVFVGNPRRSFDLVRKPNKDQFIIEWTGVTADDYKRAVSAVRFQGKLVFAAFSIAERKISDFMAEPEFAVTTVDRTVQNGEALLTVHFTGRVPNSNVTREGWFSVAPSDSWALREAKLALGNASRQTGTFRCRYEGTEDGVPLLKSAEATWEHHGEVAEQYQLTVHKLKRGAVRDREFSLLAFGLPDFDSYGSGDHSGFSAFWLLGLGAICGMVALWLRWRARRV